MFEVREPSDSHMCHSQVAWNLRTRKLKSKIWKSSVSIFFMLRQETRSKEQDSARWPGGTSGAKESMYELSKCFVAHANKLAIAYILCT